MSAPHCLGSEASKLYDEATGNDYSTTVGDTQEATKDKPGATKDHADKTKDQPIEDKVEAARKRWNDAEKRAWAAGKRTKEANDDMEKKQNTEEEAWDQALGNISGSRIDYRLGYRRSLDMLKGREEDSKKAKAIAGTNPSPENEDKSERAHSIEEWWRGQHEEYREKLIESFSKEDRDAWKEASEEARQAESAAASAEEKLRDARWAAAAAENALREIQPPVDPNAPARIPIE